MEDYEQLYYDALYTIKKLKEKNEALETDLQLINSNKKNNIKIKNIILEQIKKYKEEDILKAEDTMTFYVREFKEQCHCVICCSNKTFSTDLDAILYHTTSRRKLRGGFSCFELKSIDELKNLVRFLRVKGFIEEDYFKEEKDD